MALSFEALSVDLAGRAVLRDVSATFQPGRVTAILGPNGAGKSSLVRAAAALVTPAAGRVTLDGQDVTALDPRERARGDDQMLFQLFLLGTVPRPRAAFG